MEYLTIIISICNRYLLLTNCIKNIRKFFENYCFSQFTYCISNKKYLILLYMYLKNKLGIHNISEKIV